MTGEATAPAEPEIEIVMETEAPPPSPIVRGFLSYPTQPPAEDVLAGDAWLRVSDLAFFNSSAGAGKSVALVQASIAWGLGLPYFGIKPSRPLRILHFIGEDDASTMGQCREGLLEHAEELFGRPVSTKELATLDDMVRTDFSRQYVGKPFIQYLDERLTEEPADLVMINPLLSYIGGEIVANASEFLRVGLMPTMQKHRAANLIAHHTNKLSKDGWDTIDPTYSGTGGGEVANAPRTILTLMPTKVPGLSVLRVSKRQTTGWKDDGDRFTDHVFLKRTDNPSRPAWIPVPHNEAADLIDSEAPAASAPTKKKASGQAVADAVRNGAMERQALLETIRRNCRCSERPAKDALKEARENGLVQTFNRPNPKGGHPILWVCLPEHLSQWVEGVTP